MMERRSNLLPRAFVAAAVLVCSPPAIRAVQQPDPPRTQAGSAKQETYDRAARAAGRVQAANRLMTEGKNQEAEKEFLEADKLVPDYCTVLIPLSTVQLRLGKTDAALATLERAIRRGKAFDDKAYLLAARIFSERRQFGPGEKALIEWAGNRQVTANFHAAIGILRMGSFELAAAEVEMREALKMDPANEAALTGMSELYGRLNQYPRLQPFLDAGLQTKPDSVTILLLAGNALLRQERFAEAKEKYDRILKKDPRQAVAMVNLGSCLHGLGDVKGAEQWFRKAIETDGKNVEAPINLARALEQAGKAAEGRDVLLSARKRGLDSLEILNSLVVAYRLTGEYDAALAVAGESLKRNPAQPKLAEYLNEIERDKSGASAPRDPSGAGIPGAPARPDAPPTEPVRP